MDTIPDSMPIVHGAHMGPTWVLSAPDGPHVGSMNLAIRDVWQCFVAYGICTLNCETRKWSIWDVYRHTMVDILDTIIAKIKSEGQRLLFFILHILNDVTINSNKSTNGGYHGYVYWDETMALQTKILFLYTRTMPFNQSIFCLFAHPQPLSSHYYSQNMLTALVEYMIQRHFLTSNGGYSYWMHDWVRQNIPFPLVVLQT